MTAANTSVSSPFLEPTTDAEVMFRILSTHLEHLTLSQQPVGLRLLVELGQPTRQQFGLFGAMLRDPNRFGETLAQLSALVGVDQVGFPNPKTRTNRQPSL